MGRLSDLREQVAALFDKVQDPEIVKPLATVQNLIAEAEKEEGELLVKHNQLKNDYKEAIKNQIVSDKPEVPNSPRKEKSPAQILKENGLEDVIKLGA